MARDEQSVGPENQVQAVDVGIDGGGASADEAAMHEVGTDDEY